jgi:hypothetical protein
MLSLCVPCRAVAQSASIDPPTNTASADENGAFAARAWHLELGGQGFGEAWNYNGSREELYSVTAGLAYGRRDGLMLVAAVPMFYVSQRGSDAALLGVTGGVRWRVVRGRRANPFVELLVGVSRGETYVPPRGTRFNYIFQPGAGTTYEIRKGLAVVGTIRWLHISNNSLAGRSRNPDIEAFGLQLGVLLPF